MIQYIIALIDKSGSMMPKAKDTREGFNKLVSDSVTAEQTDNIPTFLSVVKFNGEVDEFQTPKPVAQVVALDDTNYSPGGSTNLYGAIGRTVAAAKKYLTREKRPYTVTVAVFTDGMNTDTDPEFSNLKLIKDTVESLEKDVTNPWTFMFFGGDLSTRDVEATTSSLGFNAANTFAYNMNELTSDGTTTTSNAWQAASKTVLHKRSLSPSQIRLQNSNGYISTQDKASLLNIKDDVV